VSEDYLVPCQFLLLLTSLEYIGEQSNTLKTIMLQIDMTLFCKQCNSRRLPEYHQAEKTTLWLCAKCKNFTDINDLIIREQTDEEREIVKRKHDEFEKTTNFPKARLNRRKGVN
jgi:DNA-directed RNA polymerase subunit RPC12/RpoP